MQSSPLSVLLSCVVVFKVTRGDVRVLPEEFLSSAGGLKPGSDRSSHTEPDHSLSWIHLQDSIKRQTFLNSHRKDSKHSAVYGFNQFSFLSSQQFKDLYLRARPETVPRYEPSPHRHFRTSPYPLKFDWRDHKAVGPVHDQKSCGGCWAFSVVSAVESARVKDGETFQELSVQQVIDCAYKSQGCDGGSPVGTLAWLKQSGEKLVNETEYPYEEKTGVCRVFPWGHAGVVVKDYAAFNFSVQ